VEYSGRCDKSQDQDTMSTRWTEADVKRLTDTGRVRVMGSAGVANSGAAPAPAANVKVVQSEPEGIAHIKLVLKAMGVHYETEHRFHEVRRFRFDIAIPHLMIAIEYEGLVATGKKGGHQTRKHYTKDCQKYNLATELGWRVYRYTNANYKDFKPELIK
jgi:hypothetical protein